jgi:hypothetical protein
MFSAAAERRASWYDSELEPSRPRTGLKQRDGTNGSVFVRNCGWTVGSQRSGILLSMGFSGAVLDAPERPIFFATKPPELQAAL